MTIKTREEVINHLVAAAELEHALMAQYLYAAMTLKERTEDGLTTEQVAIVRRWSGWTRSVARQEMGHLATVLNLLEAVGGGSHLNRMQFPSSTGLYTPSIPFVLEPLTLDTIERFIAFETPDTPPAQTAGLAPIPVVFQRVGELYGDIKTAISGFDEAKLFIGRITGQDQDPWSGGITVGQVTDRASAIAAIDTVIVEGEGSPISSDGSHWGRFKLIRQQMIDERAHDAAFVPHRDVVANPSALHPQTPAHPGTTAITEPDSYATAELFNASYTTLLLALAKYYRFDETVENQDAMRGVATGLMMRVLARLGPLLSRLPAGNGKNAGPPFQIYTLPSLPDDRDASLIVLRERLDILENFARDLSGRVTLDDIVAKVAQQLQAIRALIPA